MGALGELCLVEGPGELGEVFSPGLLFLFFQGSAGFQSTSFWSPSGWEDDRRPIDHHLIVLSWSPRTTNLALNLSTLPSASPFRV